MYLFLIFSDDVQHWDQMEAAAQANNTNFPLQDSQ